MSCYRPLISKLWKQDPPRSDIRGYTRSESVTNNGVTCHEYPRLRDTRYVTQESSVPCSVPRAAPAVSAVPAVPASSRESRGVLSLGLPLGISSLKLGSRRYRRKQKKKTSEGREASGQSGQGGHVSDGEIMAAPRTRHWYRELGSSRQTINDEDDLIGQRLKQTNTQHQPAVTKSIAPAARKSSPGRKSQIGSARYDELTAVRPRSVSVDADLLMQSAVTSETRAAGHIRVPDTDSELRFAGLTSPSRFMMARDKSSSGNSSASDGTVDTDSDTWHHAALSPGHVASTPPRHVSRAPVSVITSQAPPPRHLLPSKLRPSPGVKCHPYVALPQHLTNRGNRGNHELTSDISAPI